MLPIQAGCLICRAPREMKIQGPGWGREVESIYIPHEHVSDFNFHARKGWEHIQCLDWEWVIGLRLLPTEHREVLPAQGGSGCLALPLDANGHPLLDPGPPVLNPNAT